ncbi:MAG: hypothetical protein QOD06_902 [Candidatus Binatota bacterium]|nr:hypothetical protein [Candidatus Binatota bacterium]
MNFGLSEDQLLFQRTLRAFLADRCPPARVRAVMDGDRGHDAELWAEMAALGIAGLALPVELGGSGLGVLDLGLAAEELGYAATPGPFLGAAMAVVALREAPSAAAEWLPRVAAGDAILTVACGEEGGVWDPGELVTRSAGNRLRGRKSFVPYAAEADAVLVAAQDETGPGLWLVARGAPGVVITPYRGVDPTRRLHAIDLDDTPATLAVSGAGAIRRSIDAGLALLAADAYGGARRCLDLTLQHVQARQQFDRPLAAFQAVRHQLANLACELEPCQSLWWYAAHALDRIPDRGERLAALAKAHLTDVFDRIVRDATELHGGLGFTWDYDLQIFFRRAIFDRSFLGDAAYHRDRAAALAGW